MQVTSKQNDIYKNLKQIILKGPKDLFFIEGKKLLLEVLDSPHNLKQIFIDKQNDDFLGSISKLNKNVEVVYMENELIASLYTTENKPDAQDLILGIAEPHKWDFKDLNKSKNLICLVEVQDPGNLGGVFRSALAFGAGGILLKRGSASPFNTKVLRASAGAVFKLPFLQFGDVSFIKDIANTNKVKVIATSAKCKRDIKSLVLTSPLLFLFGNEGKGLPKSYLDLADEVICLPHDEKLESLNLTVAASIILWECYKQGSKDGKRTIN